eukprot:6808503-Pyramimonas_sp.AAC.1
MRELRTAGPLSEAGIEVWLGELSFSLPLRSKPTWQNLAVEKSPDKIGAIRSEELLQRARDGTRLGKRDEVECQRGQRLGLFSPISWTDLQLPQGCIGREFKRWAA